MIKCKQFKDYIIDNLSKEERKSFEEHMGVCERCKRAYNEEMMIISAFSKVPKVKPPHGLSEQIIDNVKMLKRKSIAWKIYAASVIALITATGFFSDFSLNVLLTKINVFTEIANSVGHSVYVVVNNISTVLYNNIPANSFATGVVLTVSFFITGVILFKTAFAENVIKKR